MPLFRKTSQRPAQRLAPWRPELGPLLAEIGRPRLRGARRLGRRGRRRAAGHDPDRGRRRPLRLPRGRGHPQAGELATLLQRNLEPRLTWAALGDAHKGPLAVRFAVPMEEFDPDGVLLALEALGDAEVSLRDRDARGRARGEQAEQAADAAASHRVHGAAHRLGARELTWAVGQILLLAADYDERAG